MTRQRLLAAAGGVLAIVVGIAAVGVVLARGGEARWHGPSAVAGATATQPPGPRMLTVLGAGDILLHPPLWAQAAADGGAAGYDFGRIFAGIKPTVSAADLAVCHMETPLGEPGGPFAGFPRFNVPPQVAVAVKNTGYDTCSTASNHTLDAGERGVYRTLDVLDAAGLKHAGSYRSAAEQQTPTVVDVRGVKVAHLSYTFGLNGLQRPAGKNWIANLTDPQVIVDEARRARGAGAQIVVLSIQWGVEYDHGATADQQRLARELLAAPEIDLILGCHAHVVQPVEKIGEKWVVYGMGNQIARHADPIDAGREGVMPRFTFAEVTPGSWKVTKAEAVPTWVDLDPKIRLVDLPAALADPSTAPAQRATYQAAHARIASYLRARGAGPAGLAVVGS